MQPRPKGSQTMELHYKQPNASTFVSILSLCCLAKGMSSAKLTRSVRKPKLPSTKLHTQYNADIVATGLQWQTICRWTHCLDAAA